MGSREYSFIDEFGLTDELQAGLVGDGSVLSDVAQPEEEEEEQPRELTKRDYSFIDEFGAVEPPPPQVVDEDSGFFRRSFDLVKKSYLDSTARTTVSDTVNTARQVKKLRDEGIYDSTTPGVLGMGGLDITRGVAVVSGKGAEVEADLLSEMRESLAYAEEQRQAGDAIKYSPHVQRFLEGGEDTGIIEDLFAEGPLGFAQIIWEIGLGSGYASGKGIAKGTLGGVVAGPAGFAAMLGQSSGREDYAATIVEGLRENKIDVTDPEALIDALADQEMMDEIIAKASTRAAVIGSVDTATAGLATKAFGGKFVNMLTQMGIQTMGGASGEAISTKITEGEVDWRAATAEGLGELVTAPVEVAGAAYSARKETVEETRNKRIKELIDKLETEQLAAEEEALAAGGDMLDVLGAGAEGAARFAETIAAEVDALAAQDTGLDLVLATEEDVAVEEEKVAAPEISDKEVAAEIKTELEREQIQKEAGEKYVAQSKEQLTKQKETEVTFTNREKALAKQVEQERSAIEGETELETVAAMEQVKEPEPVTLGEKLTEAQQKAKAKKAKTLEGRRVLEKEKSKPALLEDKRPSTIVVDPEGSARPMTAAEMDTQIRRRADIIEQQNLDLEVGDQAAPNIPVQVLGLDLEIENPKGSTRTGTDKNGETWSQTFDGVHYGNIKGVRGADNERLDVYVGEQDMRPIGQKVWVINQYKPDGTFDEHKVMFGFGNKQEAIEAYERHNGGNMSRGETVEMGIEELKSWAFEGGIKNKPLGSPEVLTSATESDLELMQDRAVGKGRKKPKIMFAAGTVRIEREENTIEEIQVEGVSDIVSTGSVTTMKAFDGDKEVGRIEIQRRGNKMQVRWTKVDENVRTQGIGKRLLLSAVREANEQGLELVSDTSVSKAQLRVYNSLAKTGQLVVHYSDPAAVQAFLKNDAIPETADLNLGYEQVVDRMFIPAFGEAIQMRKSESMENEYVDSEQVRTVIKLLLDFMPGIQGKVTVVETPGELPKAYYDVLIEKNQTDARGFHVSETGEIFIIAVNNTSTSGAVNTFLHEAVGHYGLQKVFGDRLNPLLDEIWEKGNQKEIMKYAEKYGADVATVAGRRLAVEEYIAHLAETQPDTSLLARVVDFIREVFKAAGILDSWSDNDIHSLLRGVRRELRSKPLNTITLKTQAEIEETGEVVTLEQPADVALRRQNKRMKVLQQLRECVG